jgi:hypothetical protein
MREEHLLFTPDHWEANTRNFAYFYAAAIALDTYNFKESFRGNKWNEEDAEAWTWFSQFYTFTDNYF